LSVQFLRGPRDHGLGIDAKVFNLYENVMNLSLEHWRSLAPSAREAAARQLALSLPAGFSFDSMAGENAFFTFEVATFTLIPGGVFSVGFDAGRSWDPTPEEAESWRATAEEYGLKESIHEHVLAATLRTRRAELAPFLIETTARELGWESIPIEDPEVESMLKAHRASNTIQLCRGGVTTRVRKRKNGSMIAERSLHRTHAELLAELRASGFRFPTSDEWEYVCGAGEPTLFRWGDHAPCDRYPTDISPNEAAYRREWVLSGGQLKPPLGAFVRDWDLHVKPNVIGVSIASNPYHYELVEEIGVTRGGDGGCTICGGAGFFAGWLTLATAYFEEHSCKHDPVEPISPGYTIGRRVLELS